MEKFRLQLQTLEKKKDEATPDFFVRLDLAAQREKKHLTKPRRFRIRKITLAKKKITSGLQVRSTSNAQRHSTLKKRVKLQISFLDERETCGYVCKALKSSNTTSTMSPEQERRKIRLE